MDIDLLISEVQKRPVLWDTADENYKDRNKKNAAWIAVAEAVCSDFGTKLEAEQKVIVHNVTAKWKAVRDNFIRNLKKQMAMTKSGVAATKLPHYVYEEQLRFLHKTREMRQTESTIDEEENHDNNASVNDNNHDDPTVDTLEYGEENSSQLSGMSQTPTTSTSVNRKRKRTTTIEDKVCLFIDNTLKKQKANETNQPKEADDDMAFFSSLLPTVKLLTNDAKLQFRIEVLQTLQRFKNKTTTDTCNNQYINSQNHSYSNVGNCHYTGYTDTNRQYTALTPMRPASTSSAGSYLSHFSPESVDCTPYDIVHTYLIT